MHHNVEVLHSFSHKWRVGQLRSFLRLFTCTLCGHTEKWLKAFFSSRAYYFSNIISWYTEIPCVLMFLGVLKLISLIVTWWENQKLAIKVVVRKHLTDDTSATAPHNEQYLSKISMFLLMNSYHSLYDMHVKRRTETKRISLPPV